MGIRRKGRFVTWKIYVPEELAAQVELMLIDDTRKRPMYGAKSQLVTNLLQLWVKHQHTKAKQLTESLEN